MAYRLPSLLRVPRYKLNHNHVFSTPKLFHRQINLKMWTLNDENLSFQPYNLPNVFQDVKAKDITSLTRGANHFAAVIDNRLYTWGSNDYGQAGPANTSFNLFESGDDEESVDTPFLIPGALNTRSDDATPLQVSAGHFHTLALDTQTGSVWSWGAGLLGRGSEVYDPLPAPLTLFSEAGVHIHRVEATGDYSIAIGTSKQSLSKNYMAYIWGYLPSSDSSLLKARYPAVVYQTSGAMYRLTATPHGFAVLLRKESVWEVQWYGLFSKQNYVKPYYPAYHEEANVVNSYSQPPNWTQILSYDLSKTRLLAWWGYIGLLSPDGHLLVFDIQDSSGSDKLRVFSLTDCKAAVLTSEGLVVLTSSQIQFHSFSSLNFTLTSPKDFSTFSEIVEKHSSKLSSNHSQVLASKADVSDMWYSRLAFQHNFLWAY